MSDVGLNQVLARNSLANSKIALARSYVFRAPVRFRFGLTLKASPNLSFPLPAQLVTLICSRASPKALQTP